MNIIIRLQGNPIFLFNFNSNLHYSFGEFKRYRNVVSDFSVGRQPGLRSLLSFMLGAALLCVTTAQRDNISRPNFGVYLHQLSEFELQTETWMNVFTFELPTTRKQRINDSHT